MVGGTMTLVLLAALAVCSPLGSAFQPERRSHGIRIRRGNANTGTVRMMVAVPEEKPVLWKPDAHLPSSWYKEMVGPSPPRKIQQVLSADDITAQRLSHFVVETEAMAKACMAQVASGEVEFAAMAESISICETKVEGGAIGWVGQNDTHVDHIIPLEARREALGFKPGDVFMASSERGVHVIKVEDIMTKIKPSKKRQNRKFKGIGKDIQTVAQQLARRKDQPPTYWLETMGCQVSQRAACFYVACLRRTAQMARCRACSLATNAEPEPEPCPLNIES